MPTIHVKKLDETRFEVTIAGTTPTTHIVTVTPDYAAKLTGGHTAVEQLVKHSIDFLLQREPNTSILRSFELPIIGRYFPEYEREIIRMLK